MKHFNIKLYSAMILLALISNVFLHAKDRIWTSDMGTEVEAEFVDYQYGQVTLKATDGRTLKVPLARFSKIDQKYIRTLNEKSLSQQKRKAQETFKQYSPSLHGATLVTIVLAIGVACITSIMLIIMAFSESFWWGLGYLFVPFAAIFFVAFHWHDTKKVFLWNLASGAMIIGVVFLDVSLSATSY